MSLLEGRAAFLTGAASGIGAATARRFCEQGAHAFLADRDPESLEAVKAELRSRGFGVHARQLDVTDDDDVQRAIEEAHQRMGHLDTIVASAGILFLRRGAETTADELEHVLRVNVIGVHSTFRHALPAVRESGHGVLLATASLASFHGSEWLGAYSASKFALLGLTQALAQEEACHGVRVCTVSPGFVQTGMMPAWLAQKSETKQIAESDVVRAMAERISLGRIGEPEEVADVLVFLASPLARYITGANIAVDGGYRA